MHRSVHDAAVLRRCRAYVPDHGIRGPHTIARCRHGRCGRAEGARPTATDPVSDRRTTVGFLARGEPAAPSGRCRLRRRAAGRLARRVWPYHHPLAVDLEDHPHLTRARDRDAPAVEGVDVDRCGDHQLGQPSFAQRSPAPAFDRLDRLAERAAHRIEDGESAHAQRVPARRQRQRGVRGVHVGQPAAAVRDAGDAHGPEQAGQQPRVPHLPRPDHAVRPHHDPTGAAADLFGFTHRAQCCPRRWSRPSEGVQYPRARAVRRHGRRLPRR